MTDLAGRLYWLGERLRGRGAIRERLDWLEHTQSLSARELSELQQEKLAGLIDHAYRTVPYYRALFDRCGLRPSDVTSVADLSKLPTLDRPTLLTHQDDLLSTEADHATLQVNYSSGTTGRRAAFRQDANFRLWMRAHQLRTYRWCGDWRIGERFALLWGSEIYWRMKSVTDRAMNLLSNRREFNTFRLSPAFIEEFAKALSRFDPVLISSYSNALHLVMREFERRGLRLRSLRAVQATSEPFPPEMRRRLETVAGCEVFDKYGSRETNIIAHESPAHDGMLIQVENVVAEILTDEDRPAPPGQRGRLVVTTLNNRSMPLIRYEMGDLTTPLAGISATSFQFPRMGEVAGRRQDLIVTPDGAFVDAYFFSYLFMRFPEVDWFQVIQDEVDRLRIRLVARGPLTESWRAEVIDRIARHTGAAFRLEFELLDEMPSSVNGKFRLCVSNIDAARAIRRAVEGEVE